jgi:hypothetical protein
MAAVVGMVDRAVSCIHYRKRNYKYQLEVAHAILLPELADPTRAPIVTDWLELDPDGTLRFRGGYAWDGASGFTIDTKSSMRPSLYHDGGYQLLRMGLLSPEMRKPLDRMFYRICREDEMLPPRAWAWFHLVRIGAGPAAEAGTEPPVETAGCGCP